MATLTEATVANVRAEVARRRIRQREVAAALGVTQATVSLKLSGRRPLTLNDLERLAVLLDVSPRDLLPPKEAA